MTGMELISKIYKYNSVSKKKKQIMQSKKWAEGMNRHFSKEDVQMANKHIKRSTLQIISEM